jgi:diguanylate cyclase (GGDEF)-like protein
MEILDYDENQESQKRLIFDLTTMLDIAKTLNSSLSLDDVLDIIILTCNGHFHASDAVILLTVEKDTQIFFQYATEDQPILLPSSHPFIRYIQESQSILHISDLKKIPELGKIYERFVSDDIELIVGLKFKGSINGILCLKKKERDFGETYTDNEKRLVEILAGFASVAIENARLYEMATLDRKTGLYNHGYFQNRLIEEIGRAERYNTELALMMIDLDLFKNVNDTYGHMVGDEVLIRIAHTIQEQVRSFDIPARFGGEEFSVILPETDHDSARKVAERLRKKISEITFSLDGSGDEPLSLQTTPESKASFSITISVGITSYQHSAGISEDILIEQADKALYNAKNSGRNRVVCYRDIEQKLST